MIDTGLLLAAWPALARAPRGDGHRVLVLPGLVAADSSTLVLRNYLGLLGYETHGWGLGTNLGPTRKSVQGMRGKLEGLLAEDADPVSLVGWSMGGISATRLAGSYPGSVRQVITLGSPLLLRPGSATPKGMPTTALHSRCDGIVPWQLCLDPRSHAESIEVRCSHLGFGTHPAALWAIADRLAQRPGAWRAFDPPGPLRWWYPTHERGAG